ncbi:unnamed protein product [Caretta caretta]
MGKVRTWLFCRDYTRGASRQRGAAIEQLEWEVLELERHLVTSPQDSSLCGVRWEKREELQALEDHQTQGTFVQSRIHLLQKMDRGSLFFYTLEKRGGGQRSTSPAFCTDHKVIAKAISWQLGSVLADVIHLDQTYAVLGHTIFDNLYLVRDLLELGCRDGLSFALRSLDQEKAFDRVLYTSVECLVRLNWTLTEPVSFRHGVHQGCPLSGQLYTLAIELFLCLLRQRLTGLVLCEPELWLILSAYANDVLLVVQDLGNLVRVEACQAICSSVQINWVKSSGLVVGDGWQVSSLSPALQAIR